MPLVAGSRRASFTHRRSDRYLRDLARAVRSGTLPGTAEFAQIVATYDFVVPA
jgi:hypothetical protein